MSFFYLYISIDSYYNFSPTVARNMIG